MKAIGFTEVGSIDQARVLDIDEPSDLKEGEVLIDFRAGSLNHLDVWVVKGLPRMKYRFPHVAGADCCGVVLESKGSRFRARDRVLVYPAQNTGDDRRLDLPENRRFDFEIRGESAPGVFRERLVVSEEHLVRAPEHLSDLEAAALPLAFLTAWQMVREKANLTSESDEPILVHGAGSGVSHAVLELLLSQRCQRIAVTSRHPEKLQCWQARGVSGFLHGPQLESELKRWAEPDRLAVIFDHVGPALLPMNIRLLRDGGKLICCGATSAAEQGPDGRLNFPHFYFRQLELLGSTMGSLKSFRAMINWVNYKKIHPQVSATIPFKEPQAAYKIMKDGRQNGKIVITAN